MPACLRRWAPRRASPEQLRRDKSCVSLRRAALGGECSVRLAGCLAGWPLHSRTCAYLLALMPVAQVFYLFDRTNLLSPDVIRCNISYVLSAGCKWQHTFGGGGSRGASPPAAAAGALHTSMGLAAGVLLRGLFPCPPASI